MPRLPTPGSDNNQWGDILNEFLAVEHNSDGSLKSSGSLASKTDKSANLSDLASASTARTNLGLGDSATKNTGTAAGTVAAGDDGRIIGAVQSSTVDAAGDLLVGTADNTVGRLGAGAAGLVPTSQGAGSALAYGLPAFETPVVALGNVTGAVDLTTDAAQTRTITATLTGNITVTLPTPSGAYSYTVTLVLIQDATGSRTLTLPVGTLYAYGVDLVLTTTANAVDIVHLLWTGSAWVALMGAPAIAT